MDIVDGQLHVSEVDRSTPGPLPSGRPWTSGAVNHASQRGATLGHLTNETAIAYMDAVGVSSAILIVLANMYREKLPDGTYRYDNTYAEEGAQRFPGRLATMAHLDHRARNVTELVAGLRERPGTLGMRVVIGRQPGEGFAELAAGDYEPMFSAAERHEVPIMLFVSDDLRVADGIAAKHPGLRVIIDHIGIPLPPLMPPDSPDPWQRLPILLAMARYPNVAVKLSRVPQLSQTGYPFRDIWPQVHKMVDAFTPDRVMWGSDITTCGHTYAEAVHYLRDTAELSEGDKAKILGGTIRTWLRWPKEMT